MSAAAATTDRVAAPRTTLLHRGRPVLLRVVRRWWDLEVHGADLVPATGPVVVAANHVGWLDGPLMAICSPRAVHALTKLEMFDGPLGRFLLAAGQIPLDRRHVDVGAVRLALRTLEAGAAVGVFPEGSRGSGEMAATRGGAAYLALVSGAPVVPLCFLGTRLPGGSDGSLPPRGSRLVMTFGAPLHLGRQEWPRTQQEVASASARVTAAIIETMREAEGRTGMTLPGPLGPPREKKK